MRYLPHVAQMDLAPIKKRLRELPTWTLADLETHSLVTEVESLRRALRDAYDVDYEHRHARLTPWT